MCTLCVMINKILPVAGSIAISIPAGKSKSFIRLEFTSMEEFCIFFPRFETVVVRRLIPNLQRGNGRGKWIFCTRVGSPF
jgi:hypothetical protein